MSKDLTRVELFYLEGHINYWLRFGDYSFEKNIDRRRAFVWFKPGQTFCYIRWWSNDYGTQGWTLAIFQAPKQGENCMQYYPGISLGVEILLWVKGGTYVKRVLEILDKIEGEDINLSEASPNYWRYLGQCILMGKTPHLYEKAHHQAWQKMESATGETVR